MKRPTLSFLDGEHIVLELDAEALPCLCGIRMLVLVDEHTGTPQGTYLLGAATTLVLPVRTTQDGHPIPLPMLREVQVQVQKMEEP